MASILRLDYLGLAAAAYVALKIANFAHLYLRPSSLPRYKHGVESWVFITGASDGIGLGFAYELARNQFNLILLGHKPDELASAKTNIELQSPGVKVCILVVDAVSNSLVALDEAVTTVKALHITMLINNVGGLPIMSESNFKTLAAYTVGEVDGTINLNARFMAQLTRLLLPTLLRNGPSLVMNIGSGGTLGVPYEVMYAGSKGFVASFSAALATEAIAENWPLEVMAIVPGHVRTASNVVPLSWSTPSPTVFARAALDRIGCGLPIVAGYWRHALQMMVIESMPTNMKQKILIAEMKHARESKTKEM